MERIKLRTFCSLHFLGLCMRAWAARSFREWTSNKTGWKRSLVVLGRWLWSELRHFCMKSLCCSCSRECIVFSTCKKTIEYLTVKYPTTFAIMKINSLYCTAIATWALFPEITGPWTKTSLNLFLSIINKNTIQMNSLRSYLFLRYHIASVAIARYLQSSHLQGSHSKRVNVHSWSKWWGAWGETVANVCYNLTSLPVLFTLSF